MPADPTDRFRTFRSSVMLDVAYVGEGPLLVKGPDASLPDRPDMAFVRYPGPELDTPFLPGSSVKGVLRSGLEAVLRGLDDPRWSACDPFGRDDESCNTSRLVKNGDRARCPACLLFGSMHGAGVAVLGDALPWPAGSTAEDRRRAVAALEARAVVRSGVAIDRFTGTASQGRLYDFEALVDPVFYGTVQLRNPEPWQVGLFAVAVRLLDDGLSRVGSATSRGLGRVRVLARRVTVRVADPRRAPAYVGADASWEADGLLHRWAPDARDTLREWQARAREWMA